MIEFCGVSHFYGDFQALDNLSLKVEPGEFFSFLGCNGAGKTTSIKIITGLMAPTSGRVLINDLPFVTPNELAIKRLIGYVPDRPYIPERLTAREFLYYVARLYDLEKDVYRPETERLLKMLFLEGWGDEIIENFSHGMRQKVVIAAALLHKPRLLMVDEPTIGLDPRSIRVVKDVLADIAQSGVTVFLSTHSLEIAEELSDRIAIIHHGKMIEIGSMAELRARSNDPGSNLENIFLTLTSEEAI